MATAAEKRNAVIKKYEEILGRNLYNQNRRDYCYKKYSDGKYYSDCSSSVSYAYKEAGFSFGILNTVGMYNSEKLFDVPVIIKDGIIQNPEVLLPGDMLLFAGKDSSRASAGYVGHVEMVAKIGSTITIYGHGSDTPRKTEMNAYCRSRFAQETSTKLGHRGLIRVRRFIKDDGSIYLAKGMEGAEVKELQQNLVDLGYNLGTYGKDKNGVDGDFGSKTETALKEFQAKYNLPVTGIYTDADEKAMKIALGIVEAEIVEDTKIETELPVVSEPKEQVKVKSGTWNLRTGPGTKYATSGTVKGGKTLKVVDHNEWIPVEDGNKVLWISKNAIEE